MSIGDWHLERPNGLHSAYNHITVDAERFTKKWTQSKYHKNASEAERALIGAIYDSMKRYQKALGAMVRKDKDEDKAFAIAASVMADPEDNKDLDY